jgi:putative aminopeptidase FrvX
MKSHKFLEAYLNAYAPVAQETEGQKMWMRYISDFSHSLHMDAYGTGYGIYKCGKEGAKKVVIEAHCDEISWIITHIEKDGYIRVRHHGGSDNMIAPSKTVVIHTHDGRQVKGVFGWPAIHTRTERTSKGYEPHELWIDVGVSSDEEAQKLGVEVGCLATFDTQFSMIGDYYVGRSLDNKIGGYIIAEVLKRMALDGEKLDFDLYVVNSVQEEVGLYGAKKIAKELQADLALVHDVCHNVAHPKMDKAKHGPVEGGKGPSLEYTSQNHRGILNKLKEVAKANELPLQHHVGSYGNDTMAFFLENTPTAILASPLKYMHTTVEMVHRDDVENCIKLYIAFLKEIDEEWIDNINNPLNTGILEL